jgi:hypothetical protein
LGPQVKKLPAIGSPKPKASANDDTLKLYLGSSNGILVK